MDKTLLYLDYIEIIFHMMILAVAIYLVKQSLLKYKEIVMPMR